MDYIERAKKVFKERAIKVAEKWISKKLAEYEEPARAGTPKGDPVGFSRKKQHSALLMLLYPTFSLKEIAKAVGNTDGVIRVYRTQKAYQRAVEEICKEFAVFMTGQIEKFIRAQNIRTFKAAHEQKLRDRQTENKAVAEQLGVKESDIESIPIHATIIGNTAVVLRSELERFQRDSLHLFKTLRKNASEIIAQGRKLIIIDDSPEALEVAAKFGDPKSALAELAEYLPFYNPKVGEHVISMLALKMKDGVPGYDSALLRIQRAFEVQDMSSLKKWQNQPQNRELTKAVIKCYVDTLTDPGAWEQLGKEKMKEIGHTLKELCFNLLDPMA